MASTPRIDNIEKNTVRNIVINGSMDFWQRGTSFAAADGYTVDRFRFTRDIGTTTISRSTDVPTVAESGYQSQYSMLLDVTATATPTANTVHRVDYRMEGLDVATIVGKTALISFWVKTNKLGTYGLGINKAFTGRQYQTEYTIDQSNTWTKIVKKIPIESSGWVLDNTFALDLEFTLAAGPNRLTSTLDQWFILPGSATTTINQVNFLDSAANEFRLAQVMLTTVEDDFDETIDVPFQRAGRTTADELAMCQRYYSKSYDVDDPPGTIGSGMEVSNTALGGNAHTVIHKVTMRASPATTIYSSVTGASGQVAMAGVGDVVPTVFAVLQSQSVFNAGGGLANNICRFHATHDAEL